VESVEGGDGPLRIKIRCFSHVRPSRLRRLLRTISHCFSIPLPTPSIWIQAREYCDASKTWKTCDASGSIPRYPSTDIQPGDLCCSLTSDVSKYGNYVFTLRTVQLEKEVFKLVETIELTEEGPEFPRAIVRTTVNII
jgi:hypothetical protein